MTLGSCCAAWTMSRSVQGGRLSVQAQYDDAQPDRPLVGTANIEQFRIRDAPAFGKLLQAMTLYGLVEVVQGPGLGFTRLVAPFRLTDSALELTDARAFSQSLGLTAKGRLDLDAQTIDLQGTIVPAYFFNTLLGQHPAGGQAVQPGARWRRVRGELCAARSAGGPERVGQSAGGADAGVPAGVVRIVLTVWQDRKPGGLAPPSPTLSTLWLSITDSPGA